jgi:spermidine/putrescine-binding protein
MREVKSGRRRGQLLVLGAVAVALTLVGCQTGASAQPSGSAASGLESELVINNLGGTYGDAVQAAYVVPFQGETGVKVTYDEEADNQITELPAQAEVGQIQWDVIGSFTAPHYQGLFDQGLLETLDHAALGSDGDDLAEGATQPWGLGQNYEAVTLGYNQTAFAGAVPTVNDFFDAEAFPGDRALVGDAFEAWNPISLALVADGVPTAELTPLDYDRAFAKLDTIKPSIKVYYTSGGQMVQLMLDKQAVMCLCTDGRMLQAQRQDPDIKVSYDGALRTTIYWAVPKGAPHPNAAMAFLSSTLDPAAQATFTSIIGYSGVSEESYQLLPPDLQDQVLSNPTNFEKTFAFTPEQNAWFAENASDIAERWAAYISE